MGFAAFLHLMYFSSQIKALKTKNRSYWWLGFPYLFGFVCALIFCIGVRGAEETSIDGVGGLGWIVGVIIVAARGARPKKEPVDFVDPQLQLQQEMERITTPAQKAEGIELEPLPPVRPALFPPIDSALSK